MTPPADANAADGVVSSSIASTGISRASVAGAAPLVDTGRAIGRTDGCPRVEDLSGSFTAGAAAGVARATSCSLAGSRRTIFAEARSSVIHWECTAHPAAPVTSISAAAAATIDERRGASVATSESRKLGGRDGGPRGGSYAGAGSSHRPAKMRSAGLDSTGSGSTCGLATDGGRSHLRDGPIFVHQVFVRGGRVDDDNRRRLDSRNGGDRWRLWCRCRIGGRSHLGYPPDERQHRIEHELTVEAGSTRVSHQLRATVQPVRPVPQVAPLELPEHRDWNAAPLRDLLQRETRIPPRAPNIRDAEAPGTRRHRPRLRRCPTRSDHRSGRLPATPSPVQPQSIASSVP